MKNIFKLTFVALAFVLSFVSCDNIDLDGFEPNLTSGWIEFESSEYYLLNQDVSFEIPIEYNVPLNQVNTEVSYTIEFLEGVNPGVEEGSFTTLVPRNTRDVSIPYEFLASTDGNYTVRFTITGTSNPDVIVGLEGDNPDVIDVTVVKDFDGVSLGPDCGGEANSYVTTITPTETRNVFSMSSAWGDNYVAALTGNPAFEGLFVYESVLTVDETSDLSGNFSFFIEGLDPVTFPGTNLGLDEDDEPIEPCEDLVFNPFTGIMEYSLSQNLFNGDFIVGVTLTPAAP